MNAPGLRSRSVRSLGIIGLAIAPVVVGSQTGSAAHLEVDGGVAQYWEFAVEHPDPPDPPAPDLTVPAECAGMSFDNTIVGTPGDDVIFGTNKNDLIFGLGGDDVIAGDNGADCIVGGDGNDHLDGGNGKDVLLGGPGDDVLIGSNGPDTVDGGEGDDQCDGGPAPASMVGCERDVSGGRERAEADTVGTLATPPE